MSEIIEVPFYAESVQAVEDGEAVWVVVKRVSEALGIDHDSQRQKLASKPWAVTVLITATGPDGKNYESFCVALDSLPMWLATIDANRVKPEARFKLVAYQKECARVLRDHFFGANRAQQSQAFAAMQSFASVQLEQAKAIVEIRSALMALADRSNAAITRSEARSLAGRIQRAGALKAKLQPARNQRAWAQRIRMHVTTAAGWSGSGCRYDNMPADSYPKAERALSLIERELQEQALLPTSRQLSLIKTG